MAQYATISEADDFFAFELHAEAWADSSPSDKDKALIKATRIIDVLNFVGTKVSEDQELEFPRTYVKEKLNENGCTVLTQVTQDDIPNDIKIATYYIAKVLLDDVDPDEEYETLTAVTQGFSSARTTYDRSFVQEHYNAGVPSATAWRYLKKYLRQSGSITFKRVS